MRLPSITLLALLAAAAMDASPGSVDGGVGGQPKHVCSATAPATPPTSGAGAWRRGGMRAMAWGRRGGRGGWEGKAATRVKGALVDFPGPLRRGRLSFPGAMMSEQCLLSTGRRGGRAGGRGAGKGFIVWAKELRD